MDAQTAERVSSPSAKRNRGAIIAAIVGVIVLLVGLRLLEHADHPGFVDRLTVANTSAYPVNVEVKATGKHAWLGLGTVDSRSTLEFHQVVDQGDGWVIRLNANGGATVDVPLTRAQLAAADWRFQVTKALGTQLRDAGAIPFN